jgi:outer membrane protein
MKRRYLTLLLFTIILISSGYGQKKWSLTDCIDYAHANNLRVKSAQLQANIAENNLFQAKMNILPDLNANISRSYFSGRNVDFSTNIIYENDYMSDEYLLRSNLTLFAGLTNYNKIKANEYNTLSRMQDVEKEKVDITFEIASAYLRILFNTELLGIAESQRDITSQQVDRTNKLVAAGSAAKGDLLEIVAQLAAEDLNVTNAKNELDLAYLNLTQLLDIDSVNGFDIFFPDTVSPDFENPIVSVSIAYFDGLAFLPHVKSAEYNLKASERYHAIQKGKLSPSLGLMGTLRTGYSDNNDFSYKEQLEKLNSQQFGLGLNIPIFNKWTVKNDISNAKINVLDAQNNLDLTKQQLYKEIQQAHNDATSAKEKYKSAEEAVKSYSEAFGYTEHKYNVGIVNIVEYNIAKNNFIKAESDLLQAKYEYVFALKILDFYRGIPMTL